MEIRNMTIEDYEKVHSLWLATAGMGLNDIDDSPDGIAVYLRRNPTTSFVALEGEELVGAILCGHDGRRGYIYHTAVRESCRRRGIGYALVNAATAALANEGISKVALVVFARNAGGLAFWMQLGFSERNDLCYRDHALRELTRIDT